MRTKYPQVMLLYLSFTTVVFVSFIIVLPEYMAYEDGISDIGCSNSYSY